MKGVRGVRVVWILLGLVACQKATPPSVNTSASPSATEVMKDFEMNDVKNGIKTTYLKGTEARVYEEKHYADVDQPFMIFYKEGKESSHLIAPEGRMQIDTHEVECWGGVTVVSADSSTLTTARLHYNPKTQKIISQEAVHLVKPDSVTDGIGLETDPGLERVKIGHQKVRFTKGMPQ